MTHCDIITLISEFSFFFNQNITFMPVTVLMAHSFYNMLIDEKGPIGSDWS